MSVICWHKLLMQPPNSEHRTGTTPVYLGNPGLKSKEYRNDFAPIAVHLTDAQGNSPLNPEEENVKALRRRM